MAKRTPAKGPYVLLGDNGTYYQGMVAIGPCFGGTLEQAKQFESLEDLSFERSRHWAVSGETLTLKQAKSRTTK